MNADNFKMFNMTKLVKTKLQCKKNGRWWVKSWTPPGSTYGYDPFCVLLNCVYFRFAFHDFVEIPLNCFGCHITCFDVKIKLTLLTSLHYLSWSWSVVSYPAGSMDTATCKYIAVWLSQFSILPLNEKKNYIRNATS